MLIRCNPGLAAASTRASTRWRVAALSGAASTTWSDSANSAARLAARRTPGTSNGSADRRTATTSAPRPIARRASSEPMAPKPTMPMIEPRTDASLGRLAKSNCDASLSQMPGSCLAAAKMAASTNSVMAGAELPRPVATGSSNSQPG